MDVYLTLKALHILSLIVWMAGMIFLPRLYVWHARPKLGSENDLLLQEMERRLLRMVINPAMGLTLLFGLSLVVSNMDWLKQGWLHAKLLLVFLMLGFHGFLAKSRRVFARGDATRGPGFFRGMAWIPVILLTLIVFLAVVKPF